MPAAINTVAITGHLTRDPELRTLSSGATVCTLRVAVNGRHKDTGSGEWVDVPNFFDVTVWGAQGENAATYLAKGRPVAVQGRLRWREWETDDGGKRQAVDIVAETVQFLGAPPAENPDTPDEPGRGRKTPAREEVAA
jgi:single-strand DNA-binding protein